MFRSVSSAILALLACNTFAATPATSVELEGRSSYFYEEHHPTKFDWSTATFCGGRNSRFETAESKDPKVEANGKSGTTSLFNKLSGGQSVLGEILNQKIDWESTFDKEDYSFNVHIKKHTGNSQRIQSTTVCNSKTWNYKVESATSKVTTSLDLVVPENVWVVELERIIDENVKLANDKFEVEKVYTSQGDVAGNLTFSKNEQVLLDDNVSYFFVQPKDELRLKMEFFDNSVDRDLVANIKVTFLGYNRCEKVIDNYLGGGKIFDAKKIISNLSKDFEVQSNGEISHDARMNLLFLGCLTSKPIIRNLLHDNHIDTVGSVLAGIESLKDRTLGTNKKDNVGFQDNSKFNNPLSVIQDLARFAVSKSIMQTMVPMCKAVPISRDGEVLFEVTTYAYIGLLLEKIKLLVNETNGAPSFVDYYKSLTDKFNKFRGTSYGSVKDVHKDLMISLYESYQVNNKLVLVNEINRLLNEIPNDIFENRALKEMIAPANNLHTEITVYNRAFENFSSYVIAGSDKEVVLDDLDNSLSEIEKVSKLFVDKINLYQAPFSGKYAAGISDTLLDIHGDHYLVADKNLNESYMYREVDAEVVKYKSFFKDFSSFYDNFDGDERKITQELTQCFEDGFRSRK